MWSCINKWHMIIGKGGNGKCISIQKKLVEDTKLKVDIYIRLTPLTPLTYLIRFSVGRGSFSIVQLKIYRGMHVAVK